MGPSAPGITLSVKSTIPAFAENPALANRSPQCQATILFLGIEAKPPKIEASGFELVRACQRGLTLSPPHVLSVVS